MVDDGVVGFFHSPAAFARLEIHDRIGPVRESLYHFRTVDARSLAPRLLVPLRGIRAGFHQEPRLAAFHGPVQVMGEGAQSGRFPIGLILVALPQSFLKGGVAEGAVAFAVVLV